jgi:hypothetical protein
MGSNVFHRPYSAGLFMYRCILRFILLKTNLPPFWDKAFHVRLLRHVWSPKYWVDFTKCWQVTFCFGLCQLHDRVCTGVQQIHCSACTDLWTTGASPHGIQTSVFSKSCLSTFCALSRNGIRLPKVLCSLKYVPVWNYAKWISSLIFRCGSPTV